MTFRSTLRFSLTSRRKSWRVSTNSRSGVFAVTVAVRLVSSSKAISPTKSPSPTGGDALALAGDVGLPFDYQEELLTGLTLPAEHLAGRHLEIFAYRASRTSSLRERPSNSGARFSACTFVSWLKSRTRLPIPARSLSRAATAATRRNALELPHPAVLELDTRAGREVPHDARRRA